MLTKNELESRFISYSGCICLIVNNTFTVRHFDCFFLGHGVMLWLFLMDGIRRDSYGIYGNGKTDAVPDRGK